MYFIPIGTSFQDPGKSINTFFTGHKIFVAQLKTRDQVNDQAGANPQGEPQDIDQAGHFVAADIPPGNGKIVFEHGVVLVSVRQLQKSTAERMPYSKPMKIKIFSGHQHTKMFVYDTVIVWMRYMLTRPDKTCYFFFRSFFISSSAASSIFPFLRG
jgi:hypothetical protein